jgi:ferric-dicitrate binding protein FerR (iron transport regulator)
MVTLDDGTKVWLNAASSLHYPVHFASGERKVELDGEAYFEVSEDNRRPFKVAVGDMNIEVLGTHFNVMAYDDEQQTTTTLLEGKVKVSAGTIGKIIKPGQEVQLIKSTDMLTVKKADTVASISWKNGLFEFDNTDMKSILRELSRWYNVDIVYSVGVKDRYFTGTAPRSMSLNDMLKGLSSSGIDFRVEGRKIIVLK